jgi:hypothetical protein
MVVCQCSAGDDGREQLEGDRGRQHYRLVCDQDAELPPLDVKARPWSPSTRAHVDPRPLASTARSYATLNTRNRICEKRLCPSLGASLSVGHVPHGLVHLEDGITHNIRGYTRSRRHENVRNGSPALFVLSQVDYRMGARICARQLAWSGLASRRQGSRHKRRKERSRNLVMGEGGSIQLLSLRRGPCVHPNSSSDVHRIEDIDAQVAGTSGTKEKEGGAQSGGKGLSQIVNADCTPRPSEPSQRLDDSPTRAGYLSIPIVSPLDEQEGSDGGRIV